MLDDNVFVNVGDDENAESAVVDAATEAFDVEAATAEPVNVVPGLVVGLDTVVLNTVVDADVMDDEATLVIPELVRRTADVTGAVWRPS